MYLDSPIESLPNTSSITIRKFQSLGIQTYWDLLNYFPLRYENYSILLQFDKIQEGEIGTVIGKIVKAQYQITRSGTRIQHFVLENESGSIDLNWFNQPYLLHVLKVGTVLSVAGEVKQFGKKFVMNPNHYELINSDALIDRSINHQLKHTGRIVPIYPEKRGLSSKTIREKIWMILSLIKEYQEIKEFIPDIIRSYNNLGDEYNSYFEIHFPKSNENQKRAHDRLSFDELFTIQLANKFIRNEWEKDTVGNSFQVEKFEKDLQQSIDNLPFTLTRAQQRVLHEIYEDLKRKTPMNRFLQGEVGSGKTVIAALICYLSFLNSYQSLIMAPTEILAQQHYETITRIFNNKLPVEIHPIRPQGKRSKSISNFKTSKKRIPNIVLITGSSKPKKKDLENADIIIGTHALIQKKESFKNVGLVIIDEQHRFGVAQRAQLKSKGINPHLLTMTATPIPRTVMLTLYGELDLSVIDEMPKNRLPVKTYFVPKLKRESCYTWIKKQIDLHRDQVFIVCPLIEESANESLMSVKAVKKEHEYLSNQIFREYRVGLLHGKLKSIEKQKIMTDFKNAQYDVLVATPVVEVGVDIPNATIMIIEGAERFGLAQLHQLRGRVGRGLKQSYCYLFTEKEDVSITERLSFFSRTRDGNMLAERDLSLRGPGNIFGKEQHGYIDLKIASLTDFTLIERTKNTVEYFMNNYNIDEFVELQKRVDKMKVEQISKD